MYVHSRWSRSALLVFAACAALVLTLLPPTTVQASPVWETDSGSASPEAKFEPQLAREFDEAAGQPQDFWVLFDAKADLSTAYAIDDWAARGWFVYRELKRVAEIAQADTIDALRASGVGFQPFWIANAIHVTGGSEELAMTLAGRPEVERLLSPATYELPEPIESELATEAAPAAIEWGLENINADDVWAQGIDGGGIVIASIDTGAQFDHPALVRQYRGNNGDGTFTHDYNWFDVSAACNGSPCDQQHWHGTHVTGTMVGDDGAGNQIGVAPGATWIAANGCLACSALNLTMAGQWMLAPTKLDGSNPDPAMRPHIVNNSWGTTQPSNDPFAEATWEAWRAAGIFGVFANGNMGPGCATSGAPGSRTVIYSVGAYDVNNQIASFSSRGPGQDGTVKPNIAAPGVSVRSSVPGNAYGVASGTSMATPHVAGAIALLWSAAPHLIGDVEATRDLLNLTAIDAPNNQCGGAPENNNVFGEGRLDAQALLAGQNVGRVAGTVTDESGAPVSGVRLTFEGEVNGRSLNRMVLTGADGGYRAGLPAGDYEISVEMYGYFDEQTTATVVEDETTTVDFVLVKAPMATVSGQVTDGSGHGWPLYTRITVVGVPLAGTVWSDPFTGHYSFELPQGGTHTLRFESQLPGYSPAEVSVDLGDSDQRRDVPLTAEQGSCTAPGYGWEFRSTPQQFTGWTGTDPQDGWTIVDHNGTGLTWGFDNVRERPAPPGSDGDMAIMETGQARLVITDTSLVSPVVDLSGHDAPHISFDAHLHTNGLTTAMVELSLDGGDTWSTVWRRDRSPWTTHAGHMDIPIPQAAGQAEVQLRFRSQASSTFWSLDNVVIGTPPECVPVAGGLVTGLVRDHNTGGGINDARILDGTGGERTVSQATPGDPGLDGGYYWLFSSQTGARQFTVAKAHYAAASATVEVVSEALTRHDFTLRAGRLTITPGSIEMNAQMGDRARSQAVTLSNDGTLPVRVSLHEQNREYEPMASAQALGTGAPRQLIEGDFSPAAALRFMTESGIAPDEPTARFEMSPSGPWTDFPEPPLPMMASAVAAGDGKLYAVGGLHGDDRVPSQFGWVFDPTGNSWSRIADMPAPRRFGSAAFVDGILYVIGGAETTDPGTTNTVFAYDPVADTWSTRTPIPRSLLQPGVAVLDGQIYVIGGCDSATVAFCYTESTVLRYDPNQDSWTEVAEYPTSSAYLACGGVPGGIVCAGGYRWPTGEDFAILTEAYRYDQSQDRWLPIADMPYDNYSAVVTAANGKLQVISGVTAQGGALTNQAVEYDPVTDTWSALPNVNYPVWHARGACGIYKIGGSATTSFHSETAYTEMLPGYDQCNEANTDVPWLSVDNSTLELQPGQSVQVQVAVDNTPLGQPGEYTSAVRVSTNTPYRVQPITVTLHLDPPKQWGKLDGTVTDAGSGAPILGAMVTITTGRGNGATTVALRTDEHGYYQLWMDSRGGPKQVVYSKDDYIAQVKDIHLSGGKVTTVDVALIKWSSFTVRQPM